jgi:hypothetical protein
VALDTIAELLFLPIAKRLGARFREVDRELPQDAAADALLLYSRRPERYRPKKGAPLEAYLTGVGVNKLRHARRKQVRQALREQAACAKAAWTGPASVDPGTEEDGPSGDELLGRLLLACQSAKEQAVLSLILAGERRIEPLRC